MPTLSERAMALFGGYMLAYGTYGNEERNPEKNKIEIKGSAKTVRGNITIELWDKHISGTKPLGVIPIDADNNCRWGCIDVDIYDLDHEDIVRQLEKHKLPLLVCSTKSGGAHIFLFTTEPIPAKIMQAKLRDVSALLGFGGSEIFPKQANVQLDKGDLGNWLNMPYYDGDQSTRHGVNSKGMALTLVEFLDLADATKVEPDKLADLVKTSSTENKEDEFKDGPPCLQNMANKGFPDGSRNIALFALGIFAKKKWPSQWEGKIQAWNSKYFDPPLPSAEVADVQRSLKKKEYSYQCNDHPLAPHCNAGVCRGRRYGVGNRSRMPSIDGLAILDTEPPLYFLNIDETRIELVAADLLNMSRLQIQVLEQAKTILPSMKKFEWEAIAQELVEKAITIEAPSEVGRDGYFAELLEKFVTDGHASSDRDGLITGKPWHDEDKQRYWFRLSDLMAYLERNKFRELGRNQVTDRIRKLGGDAKGLKIKSKFVSSWWVPDSFDKIDQPVNTPKIKEDVI